MKDVSLPKIEAERVADTLHEIVSCMGVPSEILSDIGTQFTADLMKKSRETVISNSVSGVARGSQGAYYPKNSRGKIGNRKQKWERKKEGRRKCKKKRETKKE